MQRDSDRANICTGSTQAGGKRKLFIVIISAKQRSDYGSNRSRIDGPVGMPADMAVDRADIKAGSAADALQGFIEFASEYV
ncbi:hypothetical protein D3C73_1357570 [compost metagenome]